MPETWSGIMAIPQDADEFLADPGNQEQVSKRLNFISELKDLELQGMKKKLVKLTEENGNLIVLLEDLDCPFEALIRDLEISILFR